MDEKQFEALRAELEEAKASIDALSGKNKELIMTNKKLKQQTAEVDLEAHYKLQDEYEALKESHSKLEKTFKVETERLTKDLSGKDSALQSILLEDGLTNALLKSGIKSELLDGAKALLRGQATLKNDGDKYVAQINDKMLLEAVGEWATSDVGKHYISAPQNSGGGANGSLGNDINKNIDISSMTPAQMMRAGRQAN